MKTFFFFLVVSFFIVSAANTFAKDPDLNGCWDVYIDQISSWGTPVDGQPGEASTEHNTIWIEQATDDNRFSGFVSNLPASEAGRNFSGIVIKRDVYITHWDSITKAKLKGKNEFTGINQAFGDSSDRDSKTAFATAIRLGSNTCCNEGIDPGETDIDCGGPCAPCFTGMDCLDNSDCLSGDCSDTGEGLVCQE